VRRTPREEPGYGAGGHDPAPESPVDRVRSMLNDYRAGTRPGDQMNANRNER